MNKYKKGFTFTEISICFIIIGIIFACSVDAINGARTSYVSLTYSAHKNLLNMVTALYSANNKISLIYEDSLLLPATTVCKNSDGQKVNVFKSDNELVPDLRDCSKRYLEEVTNTNLFCKSLVAVSNIAGEYDCTHLYNIDTEGNEPVISNIDFEKPNFTLTNGMRFYISKWDYDNVNVSETYGYRLVAIDINGTNGPNKINTGSVVDFTPTDLVTFLVLDNGEVYPLGVAANNIQVSNSGKTLRYLNARLKGYYFSDNNNRKSMPNECKNGEKCNFGVVPLGNVSYREAFCSYNKNKGVEYIEYCNGEVQNEYCPPSNSPKRFDMCKFDIIKPAFRFNL